MTDTPNNVVPPEEIARRRRVNQITDDITAMLKGLRHHAAEYELLGVATREWIPMLIDDNSRVADIYYGSAVLQRSVPLLVDVILAIADGKSPSEAMTDELAKIGSTARRDDDDDDDGDEGGFDLTTLLPLLFAVFSRQQPNSEASADRLRMLTMLEQLFAAAPKLRNADGVVDDTQAPAVEATVVLRCGASMQGALSMTPQGGLRMLSPNQQNGKPVLVEHFFVLSEVSDIAIIRPMTMSSSIIRS